MEEQFGAPFDHYIYDQLGDMPSLGAIVGRGLSRGLLGAARGPESSPKVLPMTRGACDALCSKWTLPKKWFRPPGSPLNRKEISLRECSIIVRLIADRLFFSYQVHFIVETFFFFFFAWVPSLWCAASECRSGCTPNSSHKIQHHHRFFIQNSQSRVAAEVDLSFPPP